MQPLQIDQLEREIALLCLEHPELYDDAALRADVLEGETDAFSVLSRLADRIREDETLEEALAERLARIRERKDRIARHSEGLRTLALRIMNAAHLRKVVLPEATLSVRAVPPKVEIDGDVDLFLKAYPQYQRVKLELDKTKLKADLLAGIAYLGARLTNGGELLTVNTK